MRIQRYVNGKLFEKAFDETMIIENQQISQTINNVNQRLHSKKRKLGTNESGVGIE